MNSFGYGGSNLHVVLEEACLPHGPRHVSSYLNDGDEFLMDEEQDSERPQTLVFSANDEKSLKSYIKTISNHLINPRVKVNLADLAFTLSERRTKHFHRAYVVTQNTELDENSFVFSKKGVEAPRIGFVFTGQGAQWPQMGRGLLEIFPETSAILEELDDALQSLPDPPKWSLVGMFICRRQTWHPLTSSDELSQPRSPEHLRQPEFSQPLVTALQLCIVSVLASWGVQPHSTVGHSSGEIAAAYAAGFLSRADAIKAAFYRGRAALMCKSKEETSVGMLAVGLGAEAVLSFLENYVDSAWIACINSPNSVTVSGKLSALEALRTELQSNSHFARLLQVDLAYHSVLMNDIGNEYQNLLERDFSPQSRSQKVSMFSSVTGSRLDQSTDALYWKTNMVSPVRFSDAVNAMLTDDNAANFLLEIGPSGALAGPISQIKKSLLRQGSDVPYCTAWSRGEGASRTMFDAAGRLYIAGAPVSLASVNQYSQCKDDSKPSTIIDLPNYVWNHSVKYWHENTASKDWRFRKYIHHDLLGSKILGTSWREPCWKKILDVADIPWLKEHKMGADILMPGSGYICMALEALYQRKQATDPDENVRSPNDLCYRFRNVRFQKALVIEEGKEQQIVLSLVQQHGSNDWHEFKISSSADEVFTEHCHGFIRIEEPVEEQISESDSVPLKYSSSGYLWYKAQNEIGYGFGPAFQRLLKVESVSGQRSCRSIVSLTEPPSKWSPQSSYPIHPASLDGCFQTVTPSLWAGERSSLDAVLVPSIIDGLLINKIGSNLKEGLSSATTEYTGRGRLDKAKSYMSNCSVYDPEHGNLLMRLSGLRYAELDTGTKPDPHTFDRVTWRPDVSFLTQDQLNFFPIDGETSKVDRVVDLIAHKKPPLKVLELNSDPADTSSIWFEAGDAQVRSAYLEYCFASFDAKALIQVQTKHEANRNSSFNVLNPAKEAFDIPRSTYDLAIIKVEPQNGVSKNAIAKELKTLFSDGTYVIFIERRLNSLISAPDPGGVAAEASDSDSTDSKTTSSADTPNTELSEQEDYLEAKTDDSLKSGSRTQQVLHIHSSQERRLSHSNKLEAVMARHGFVSTMTISSDPDYSAYMCSPGDQNYREAVSQQLCVIRLSKKTPKLPTAIKLALEQSGWQITEHLLSVPNAPSESTILVIDELYAPVLPEIDGHQWECLKVLVSSGKQVLWLTKGAQFEITEPDNALVPGLFRVIRREDVTARLSTLDVQSSTSPATALAIDSVLQSLKAEKPKTFVETEYVERNGIIYIHRVVPDSPVNEFKNAEKTGCNPVVKSLHDAEPSVMLRAERVGTFQSLQWCEVSSAEVPVAGNTIEVEIMATGANYKVSESHDAIKPIS